MDITKEDFEQRVHRVMSKENLSLVLAVYKIVDELSAEQASKEKLQLACCRGCSFCCHQLVTCTEIEWKEITKFIWSLERKAQYRLRKWLSQFKTPWKRYLASRQSRPATSAHEILKVHADWRGQPCPFLDKDGACTIYPVRPIDCRTTTSTIRCTKWENQEGAKRFRYPWELWGNNFIMEEAERSSGTMEITPLRHWICTMD